MVTSWTTNFVMFCRFAGILGQGFQPNTYNTETSSVTLYVRQLERWILFCSAGNLDQGLNLGFQTQTIANITAILQPCLGDLEAIQLNKLRVYEVLRDTDDCVIWILLIILFIFEVKESFADIPTRLLCYVISDIPTSIFWICGTSWIS